MNSFDFSGILKEFSGVTLQSLLSGFLTLAAGIIVIQLIIKLVQNALKKSSLEKAAHSLILSVAKFGLYVLLAITVASSLGVDITSIVALASVLTLSVSLSLQNLLSNVFGGFTILNTRPFRSGDFVEIQGQSGTVAEITMSYTKLITPDNKQISIPNSQVSASQIVNYTAQGIRRMDLHISAAYTASTQKVIDALVQAGTVDNALASPAPRAVVCNYGDNAIEYILWVWANCGDYWNVYYEVNQRVKDIFDRQDIEMTYPHLNVHLDK